MAFFLFQLFCLLFPVYCQENKSCSHSTSFYVGIDMVARFGVHTKYVVERYSDFL